MGKKTIKNLKGLQALFKEEEEGYLENVWNEMIAEKKKNHTSDFKIKRASDGQLLTINQVIEIKFEGDQPIELIGSIQDISESKTKIEEEVKKIIACGDEDDQLGNFITDAHEKIASRILRK